MNTSVSEPTRISIAIPVAPTAELEAQWQREADEAETRRRNIAAQALWEKAEVPARHADALKDLPTSGPWAESYATLRGLIGTGCICVVTGIRGTGKTQMAVKAIRESCGMERSAAYVKAMRIFLDIRDSFGAERGEKVAVARYTTPQLLVIDAMEERGETPFEDRILNHIIDIRYDNLRDTILITNQTKAAFCESAGPSIVSRIQETGIVIECDWKSFRSKGGAA